MGINHDYYDYDGLSDIVISEDVTNYAIRKYDGISSRPMTIGYANWDNAVAWIKRNCSNADGDIAVNRNYHIDDYVNGNGYYYHFMIEHVEEEDY